MSKDEEFYNRAERRAKRVDDFIARMIRMFGLSLLAVTCYELLNWIETEDPGSRAFVFIGKVSLIVPIGLSFTQFWYLMGYWDSYVKTIFQQVMFGILLFLSIIFVALGLAWPLQDLFKSIAPTG